jgi:hypothetical protein
LIWDKIRLRKTLTAALLAGIPAFRNKRKNIQTILFQIQKQAVRESVHELPVIS